MQKKVAAVHDISGFGRCALTIALPVLSACGIHCCPVPSAVLSAHTGFKGVTFRDLTDDIDPFIENWASIGVRLDGIYSGYLGSARQARQVMRLKELCGGEKTSLVVDPVMGDNGKAYAIVGNREFFDSIKSLCSDANIITPNLTECALLLGMEPDAYFDDENHVSEYMKRLSDMGPKKVVVTGMERGSQLGVGFYDGEKESLGFIYHDRVPVSFPGTGDLFTSVLTGAVMGEGGRSLENAVTEAAHFVRDCALYTYEQKSPPIEGVQFEKLLYKLTEKIR